jgi:TetR/AcrR family transcriptional regulator
MYQPKNKSEDTDPHNKRKQILNAAYTIFSRKGYHCATVDEIVQMAGTGKGTLYNYFENKEHLFYTLIKERSEPFEAIYYNIANSQLDIQTKLEQMLFEHLTFLIANGDLWSVMIHDVFGVGTNDMDEEQREKYYVHFHRPIDLLEQVVNDGIGSGILKKVDAKKTAHMIFSAITMLVFHKMVDQNVPAEAARLAHFMFYGIGIANPG